MFGICLQLKDRLKYEEQPLFAIVEEAAVIHLAAVMTPPRKLLLCAPTRVSAPSLERFVYGLIENKWRVPAVNAEKPLAESFAHVWTTAQGCHHHEGMSQRIHELRNVKALEYAPGTWRQATVQELDLVITWAQAFHQDCFGHAVPGNTPGMTEQKVSNGEVFFWVDPRPVSMAARTRPTPHGESIGSVYTPPESRRHGYATSVVAVLSQRILDEGKRFCCLYTDVANPTSNSIYRKIGYVPVADVIDIHFEY